MLNLLCVFASWICPEIRRRSRSFALATNSDGQDATAWACVTTRERCNLFDVLLDRLRDLLSLQKIKA